MIRAWSLLLSSNSWRYSSSPRYRYVLITSSLCLNAATAHFFASMLCGPWVGALTGLLTQLVTSITNPSGLPFALVSIAVGLVAGFLARANMFNKPWKIVVSIILIIGALIAFLYYRQNRGEFYRLFLFIALSFALLKGLKMWLDWQVSDLRLLLSVYALASLAGIFFIYKRKMKSVLFVLLASWICIGASIGVNTAFEQLQPHQKDRINDLLGIENDPTGAGYNVNQSKIAIGSGGFSGKGFLEGTQTKYNFVPEQSTDFIFCTIGEEWGFIGCAVVIGLFLALILRLVKMAERQRSHFSRVYGYGVASILFFHVAVNIGMTIGMVPVIGIPLPFLSYGGSSLWAFTILLFIFLRLDANRLQVFS